MNRRHSSTAPWAAATALLLTTLAGCTDTGSEPAANTATGTSATAAGTSETSTAATGTTSADSVDADAAVDLDRALAELVAMPGGPPGAIAVVQIGDDRTVHTAGVSDIATGAAPSPDDHMRIASTAKAFSGAAALVLVDQGRLSLDDTIGERLPALPAAWAEVTLRQLLSHTSGLPDFTRNPGFGAAVQAAFETPVPPGELLSFVEDEPLVFPPGTRYVYDNSDNIVVGLMVEAVTGGTYAEALAELVWEPLGLMQTTLPIGTEMPEPALRGYDLGPSGEPEDLTELMGAGWAWASGGIVSTPSDMNSFIRGYVGGELFGPETRGLQRDLFIPGGESGPPGPGANSAAPGLFRYETSCGVVYGHTGNTPGYTQFVAASPDGERSVTMTMTLARNAESDPDGLQVLHALQRAELAGVCLALGSD